MLQQTINSNKRSSSSDSITARNNKEISESGFSNLSALFNVNDKALQELLDSCCFLKIEYNLAGIYELHTTLL